jgi:hypothetical protein
MYDDHSQQPRPKRGGPRRGLAHSQANGSLLDLWGTQPRPAGRAIVRLLRLVAGDQLHNLPAQPTPLIGREQELASARRQLSADPDVRLLTFTGPPGIGKTRLALELAVAELDAFPDGVRLVHLATIRDPALVFGKIARTLDIRESPSRRLHSRLQQHLIGRRLMLVLDNFEQVLEAGPDIAALLAECRQL